MKPLCGAILFPLGLALLVLLFLWRDLLPLFGNLVFSQPVTIVSVPFIEFEGGLSGLLLVLTTPQLSARF